MDIRIVNRGGSLINVSRLNLRVEGEYVVGLTEGGMQVLVERCRNEKEARDILRGIIGCIVEGNKERMGSILITLEEGGEDERGNDKEEYQGT